MQIDPFKDAPAEGARAMVHSALMALQERIDTWLIRELVGLDPGMNETAQFGYVLPLRSFARVNLDVIETDRAAWYSEREKYFRVCRLRGLYKTDLLQRFSYLFERVGLEDERKTEHLRLFERCAEAIFPVGQVK